MTESSPPKATMLVPARELIIPAHLSPAAQAALQTRGPDTTYPAIVDKEGWKKLIDTTAKGLLAMLTSMMPEDASGTETVSIEGVTVYKITPSNLSPNDRTVILDMHGGALIYCGGAACRIMAQGTAKSRQKRTWSIDYRMPPDHPYPAPLDDCMAVYRALLQEHDASQIFIQGGSAGGNLAAALILRARDEGLPMPAGAILGTPEADLTESGDSFQTNLGVDPLLKPLMPVNLLYADGHDLKHPYLSPLFGDFSKGFPPTILTTGTRDLFLSNTVRMHRALRKAGVTAELHVLEAAGHIGFVGSPEGEEIEKEIRRFMESVLGVSKS
jgi:monoterpene epsilon-lactone hydrolase